MVVFDYPNHETDWIILVFKMKGVVKLQEQFIIDWLSQHLTACPAFQNKTISIDAFDSIIPAYRISTSTCQPILQAYVHGELCNQYTFSLSACYGLTQDDILAANYFFEEVQDWIANNTVNATIKGKQIQKIEVMKTAYMSEQLNDKKLYTMECRIIYIKKK